MHVRRIARQEHSTLPIRIGEPHVALPFRVPYDFAERHTVEVLVDEAHEAVLRRHTRSLAAVAEQHSIEATRQLHDHDEVIGAGAVVHVLVVIGEVVQMRIEVLELCAGVVAFFLLEPDCFAQTRGRTVACDEVLAAHLFLYAADFECGRDAVGVLFHVDTRRVPVG